MRLGEQTCVLNQGSLAERVYGSGVVHERHRHRYEVNINYVEQLIQSGLVVGGRSEDGELVEMIELEDHPWFLACQFHPEFTSSPRRGHPLFTGFIEAGLAYAVLRKTSNSGLMYRNHRDLTSLNRIKSRTMQLGHMTVGDGQPLFVIAGPCVIETEFDHEYGGDSEAGW